MGRGGSADAGAATTTVTVHVPGEPAGIVRPEKESAVWPVTKGFVATPAQVPPALWLALIASIMLLALPNASDTPGTVDKALPDLRSSLHLPYFSFARALRPGS